MRSLPAFLLSLVALPLSAGSIRFDPPNPSSVEPVKAHVLTTACGGRSSSFTRDGSVIAITLEAYEACLPELLERYDVVVDLGAMPAGRYDVVVSSATPHAEIARSFLTVSDAAAPFGVRPNVAPTNGRTVSIVDAGEFYDCVRPAPNFGCDAPVVKFDGVRADVVGSGLGEVIVVAPAHEPGTVDVTVEGNGRTATAVAAFHYFTAQESPDPAFFERILLPVLYSGPGSFGSMWETEAAMHNGNPYPIDQPGGGFVDNGCVTGICDMRPQPDETRFLRGTSLATGYVFWVSRLASPDLQFTLLVRDLSREATDFGTSVPIVREGEFFNRPFTLANVPPDSRYRLGLRLYAYDPDRTALRVRILGLNAGVLAERIVPLLPARDHAFAFIGDLASEFPHIAGSGRLAIEISPTQEGTLAWAYLSITNNETQHVTVIAPE